jgi:asparagine synthase (glutamine-hydrolysing)
MRLPLSLRRGSLGTKHLMRKILYRHVPRELIERPKQGFAIPLGQWFRGPLRPLAEDVLASRAFRERGLIDVGAARACLDDHLAGRADRGESLWLILSLELWARRFLDAT